MHNTLPETHAHIHMLLVKLVGQHHFHSLHASKHLQVFHSYSCTCTPSLSNRTSYQLVADIENYMHTCSHSLQPLCGLVRVTVIACMQREGLGSQSVSVFTEEYACIWSAYTPDNSKTISSDSSQVSRQRASV